MIAESLRHRDKIVGGVTPDVEQVKRSRRVRRNLREPLDRKPHLCLTTLAPFPGEMI